MGSISGVTKRDIIDLFKNGIQEDNGFTVETIYYPYYGRFEIVDFLNRIYRLDSMESKDSRLENAEREIAMHTNNGDYPDDWVFEDERFNLTNGDDSFILNFLCEVFHPEVRDERKAWAIYLDKINRLLKEDGYELVALSKISGRDLFSWRKYIKRPDMYIPFSERNKDLIRRRKTSITIPNSVRHKLFKIMEEYDEVFYFTDETNWNYTKSCTFLILDDINKFYKPKRYEKGHLIDVNSFNELQEGTSPFVIFDVIESFNRHSTNSEKFGIEINTIFKLNNIGVELIGGEIHSLVSKTLLLDPKLKINEIGLEELIRTAEELYIKGKYSYAVEKLWDAFERVKTYYYPTLNKKQSAGKIVDELSCGNIDIRRMFNDEFRILTDIGNSYRIRHHEKNKIDITDDLHYEYFYKRCLALLSVVIKKI